MIEGSGEREERDAGINQNHCGKRQAGRQAKSISLQGLLVHFSASYHSFYLAFHQAEFVYFFSSSSFAIVGPAVMMVAVLLSNCVVKQIAFRETGQDLNANTIEHFNITHCTADRLTTDWLGVRRKRRLSSPWM